MYIVAELTIVVSFTNEQSDTNDSVTCEVLVATLGSVEFNTEPDTETLAKGLCPTV